MPVVNTNTSYSLIDKFFGDLYVQQNHTVPFLQSLHCLVKFSLLIRIEKSFSCIIIIIIIIGRNLGSMQPVVIFNLLQFKFV